MQKSYLRERTGKYFRRTEQKTVIENRFSVITTGKKRWQAAILLVSVLSVTLICSSCASANTEKSGITAPSEIYTPLRPQPVEIVVDAYPQIMDSSLLSLAANYYKGEETTAEDLKDMEAAIRYLFDANRVNRTPFKLPDGFAVHETEPSPLFTTADTLAEYDKQIWDAWLKISNGMSVYQCHRMGVTALNCMDLISNNEATKAALTLKERTELLLYYANLAYWGFGNEYVFGELSRGAQIDLFYRCGQVFDHLKAFGEAPPDYYEMCFVAAAFLGLAYQLLGEANFEQEDNEYHSAVWELEQMMLQRLMEYVNDSSGFQRLMSKHKMAIPT